MNGQLYVQKFRKCHLTLGPHDGYFSSKSTYHIDGKDPLSGRPSHDPPGSQKNMLKCLTLAKNLTQ